MIDPTNPVIDLNAMDRCARCGAQAIVEAWHEKFGSLLFCAHHAREHKDKLIDTGWALTTDGAQMDALGIKEIEFERA